MIAKFTEFFLENRKITIVLIVLIAVFGSMAYFLLPKQYNPSIVAPAFSIEIPSAGYTSSEASQFVARTLENKIKELQGIDKIYSYATDGFTSVMVGFKVGVDQEVAKTRLYDKMYSNYDLKPFGINDVQIRSIDPEELPQVSFALTISGTTSEKLDPVRTGIYLRSVAILLREEIKQVPGTTLIDVLGGYRNDISVELDRKKIESSGLDIARVMAKIQSSFVYRTIGNLEDANSKVSVLLDSTLDRTKDIENLVIDDTNGMKTYLRDVSKIRSGPIDIREYYTYADASGEKDAVFLGIAKLKGTNAVFVVDSVLKKVEEMRKRLPQNVSLTIIQNEGATAKEATSELLFHLFVSIMIVLAILIVFLGMKDALNAAFCIPMVLGIVFLVAFIFGLDINRITLFALILSLGILVDDSIVMVENNSRHLAMIPRTGRTPFQAVLDSVKEVGSSIVFSTITRIMSFIAMFAVSGMMGDYMKPIPVFASIALTASLFIAFSINPFLAIVFYNKKSAHTGHDKENRFLAWYGKTLARYINTEARSVRNRLLLKIGFWFALFAIILAPIMTGVFKARMLPKADKDQVYLWIDAPRADSAETVRTIETDASNFLLGREGTLPKNLRIVENISASVWDRFLGDFANLFRGWANRVNENELSMRINLTPGKERDLKSESYVIAVRPLLRQHLFEKYPDIKFRLLEDPPGPPTQATFHVKIKGQEDLSSVELTHFSDIVKKTVRSIAREEDLVDLTDSVSSTVPEVRVALDTERIAESGLSVDQVSQTLSAFFRPLPVSFVHSDSITKEASNIIVGFSKAERKNLESLKSVVFTNARGEKIALTDIAKLTPTFAGSEVYTDNRAETIHLYAELGSNSVVYPVLKLYGLFGSSEFEKLGYRKVSSGPYGIDFVGTKDGKAYRIEWGGEWELTMDTFRDLGLAMILSLSAIYFLIVAQFKSFMVGGIVMTTFLLSFFGIFPGFAILYLINGIYFTATAMIGAIALGGIVVGNAIILLDYTNQLIAEGKWLEFSVIEGAKKRFVPVMLTSVAAVAGSFIITGDPVWSGLAWSIISWLSASALLTLFFIPIFYYSFLHKHHRGESAEIQMEHIVRHEREIEGK